MPLTNLLTFCPNYSPFLLLNFSLPICHFLGRGGSINLSLSGVKGGRKSNLGVKKSISRGGKPQPLLSDVRGRGEISISSILGWGVWNKGGVDLQTKLSERDRDPWYKRERDSGKEIPRKEKLSESGISNESRLVAGKHLILSNTCPKGTESPKSLLARKSGKSPSSTQSNTFVV